MKNLMWTSIAILSLTMAACTKREIDSIRHHSPDRKSEERQAVRPQASEISSEIHGQIGSDGTTTPDQQNHPSAHLSQSTASTNPANADQTSVDSASSKVVDLNSCPTFSDKYVSTDGQKTIHLSLSIVMDAGIVFNDDAGSFVVSTKDQEPQDVVTKTDIPMMYRIYCEDKVLIKEFYKKSPQELLMTQTLSVEKSSTETLTITTRPAGSGQPTFETWTKSMDPAAQ